MPQRHISHPRGSDLAPRSIFLEGRFGRMFRTIPSFEPIDGHLVTLSERMREEPTAEQPGGWQGAGAPLDGEIPAGYTYLGQFIDHDITFDPVSSLQRQNDPDGLQNFRTPRFDLDSLYGAGPNNHPFMYDPDVDGGRTTFLIGRNEAGDDDLPRNVLDPRAQGHPRGRALIGDPRNDENVIVSQLHLVFLKFHNRVVAKVRDEQPGLAPDLLFEEAQRVVRWHYQWVVVHDFLDQLVGTSVIEDILQSSAYDAPGQDDVPLREVRLRFFRWQRQPFMPVEFSVAVYRFGHSMIRPTYRINPTVPELPIFTPSATPDPLEDFRGFRPLPAQWTIDWSFFFDLDQGDNLQRARRIDRFLSPPTFRLPGFPEEAAGLALRNLRRATALGLPSGQRVARAMCLEPLSDEDLGIVDISPEFVGNAPLWLYVLREADLIGGGSRLGPVGGRIVAEVLLGLLKGDPLSFLNVEPCWTPELGENGAFKMPQLIRFALG
jgi:hypothetical protein